MGKNLAEKERKFKANEEYTVIKKKEISCQKERKKERNIKSESKRKKFYVKEKRKKFYVRNKGKEIRKKEILC